MTPSTVDVVANGAVASHIIQVIPVRNVEIRKPGMRLLPKFRAPICRNDNTREVRL